MPDPKARVQRDPQTGKLFQTTGGKLLARSDAPGNPCNCDCAGCQGRSSDTITVTLPTITLAHVGCFLLDFAWYSITEPTISGTFTLTRDRSTDKCVWIYQEAPGTTLHAYAFSGAGCTGAPVATYGFTIKLVRIGSQWELQAFVASGPTPLWGLFHSVSLSGDYPDCITPMTLAPTGWDGVIMMGSATDPATATPGARWCP